MPLDQVDVDKEPDYEVKKKDEMSFWEHLDELRARIIRALIAILVGVIIVFAMGEWFFNMIIYAPIDKSFPTYKLMCDIAAKTGAKDLCLTPPSLSLFTTEIGEVFFKHMQIALIVGLLGAIPFVFWQFWLFIKPGLMEEEIKAAKGFVTVCSALFIAGVLFGYFIITPFAISFLANYKMANVGGTASLDSYIGYLTMFTLPIGLVFELPVIIYFLARIGIVSSKMLTQYRKHMVVVLLLAAGIITPSPDMVSQLLVFVPLYTLFEVGIVVSKRVEKRRALAQKA
ncbi:MAG: twin-arginine translocase subunit TatC [Saprospiraceae bacterium]|nr:twin-arginine translocase subunit TatC [Saprospiraceae bacterium]